ncbi:MAG: hypothetical protein ACH0QD_13510 [Tepidibacillus sp.]
MNNIYLVEFDDKFDLFDHFDASEIVANDWEWALLEADFLKISSLGLKPKVPKPGKWVSSSGAEVYINNDGEIVDTADEVINSLSLGNEDLEAYKQGNIDADELLEILNLVF